MFSGIVESVGLVVDVRHELTNLHIDITCSFVHELKIDQSVAHNGICLTIVKIEDKNYTVTAIQETLQRTEIGSWKVGMELNLERCMKLSDRLDGHIVQGHVDTIGKCTEVLDNSGSWTFRFEYPKNKLHLTVAKGSICINGVSLTVVDSGESDFTVCIIPYTFHNTMLKWIRIGTEVNLEFDIVGKYIAKLNAFNN